jgi:serine phosphatase RsbU (regulator of sigma subunit)/pSer/pThr/pTyr-binding forkhead associated (FHA) protein
MAVLILRIPGKPSRKLSGDPPVMTVGRAAGNDIVIEDPSLSRVHARFSLKNGIPCVEDLGSLNGTLVNGKPAEGVQALKAGDRISLGKVDLTVDAEPTSAVLIEESQAPSGVTMVKPIAELLKSMAPEPKDTGQLRWMGTLTLIQETTLDLVKDISVEDMLDKLMGRLFELLKPDRGVVLLKDPSGELIPAAVKSNMAKATQIRVSKTLVEAVVERREALLINDPTNDPKLSASQSLVFSGVSSILATPLEFEGEVVGLLYLDARPYRQPFNEEELRLVASLAHVAAGKIRQDRLQAEVAKKRAMEQELSIARQIQQRLLPAVAPVIEGIEVHGANSASRQVSGDLFGFWPRPDGKWLCAIADVSGKGVGPGLLMSALQTYLEAWADAQMPTDDLAKKLSLSLAHRTTPNRFITAFIFVVDPDTGKVQFTNAGHNPGLLVRADGTVEKLLSHGMPLAMLPGNPYGKEQRLLHPGDMLFLYTDGITEATSPDGEDFDLSRVEAFVAANRGLPLAEMEHRLMDELEAFTRHAPATDDRTVVILRRQG